MSLSAADAGSLTAVQLACYGETLLESAELYRRRLSSPGGLCLGAVQGADLVAYLAGYRSRLGRITPLHGDFDCDGLPDTLYLHDLAVLPALAGRGLAARLLAAVVAQAAAEEVGQMALVAVQGAGAFWRRHGFREAGPADAAQRRHLASYGPSAVYMTRTLAR